jgi:hypothetical protein
MSKEERRAFKIFRGVSNRLSLLYFSQDWEGELLYRPVHRWYSFTGGDGGSGDSGHDGATAGRTVLEQHQRRATERDPVWGGFFGVRVAASDLLEWFLAACCGGMLAENESEEKVPGNGKDAAQEVKPAGAIGTVHMRLDGTNSADGGSAAMVGALPVVHQTWRSYDSLTKEMQESMATWRDSGFSTSFTDDRACLEDMRRLAEEMGDARFLTIYTNGIGEEGVGVGGVGVGGVGVGGDSSSSSGSGSTVKRSSNGLNGGGGGGGGGSGSGDSSNTSTPFVMSAVQRADYWRYAKLWMDGGVYSDIDAGGTPQFARFLRHPEMQTKVGWSREYPHQGRVE